jgi:hypothetical protein
LRLARLGLQRQFLLHQAAVAQAERRAKGLGVAGHQGIAGALRVLKPLGLSQYGAEQSATERRVRLPAARFQP